jgi:hypothetical protein
MPTLGTLPLVDPTVIEVGHWGIVTGILADWDTSCDVVSPLRVYANLTPGHGLTPVGDVSGTFPSEYARRDTYVSYVTTGGTGPLVPTRLHVHVSKGGWVMVLVRTGQIGVGIELVYSVECHVTAPS